MNNVRKSLSHLPLFAALTYLIFNFCWIGYRGEFPLIDDCCYTAAVKHFLESGKLDMNASSACCFVQVLLGVAVSKLNGFSIENLRLLTMSLTFLSALALYKALRTTGLHRALAGISLCAYVANPLITNVSFTFMTDAYALTFIAFYFAFAYKAIEDNSTNLAITASAMLLAGIYCRQTVALFLLPNIFLWWCLHRRSNHRIILFLGVLVFPIAWTLQLPSFMESHLSLPEQYRYFVSQFLAIAAKSLEDPSFFWPTYAGKLAEILIYCAIFAAPIVVAIAGQLLSTKLMRRQYWPSLSFAVLCLAPVFTNVLLGEQRPFPWSISLWDVPDFGPTNLIGFIPTRLTSKDSLVLAGAGTVLGIVLLCSIFIGVERIFELLTRLRKSGEILTVQTENSHNSRRVAQAILCFSSLTICVIYLAIQLMVCNLDRYYLIVLVPLFLSLGYACTWVSARPTWIIAAPLLLLMAVSSSAAEHKFMSASRARWQAIAWLEKQKVEPTSIDGGPEYSFKNDLQLWRLADTHEKHLLFAGERTSSNSGVTRWWPIHGDSYVIAYKQIPGYKTIKRYPYWSALDREVQNILVLRKD